MKGKLKARQLEILKYLMASPTPLEVKFFEEKFQKSARTVRYDINGLRTLCEPYGIEIKYQKMQGFFIPVSQKMACSELLIAQRNQGGSSFLLDTDEERGNKIFLYFFTMEKRVTAEQVAEQFFISKSTALRLITKLEGNFGKSLRLSCHKPGGYRLEGEELELRRAAAKIVSAQFKGSYTPEDWYLLLPDPLKRFISFQELEHVTDGIKKANRRHNIWISNTTFLNLLSYCVVSCSRRYRRGGPSGKAQAGNVSRYCLDLLKEISVPGEGQSPQELSYLEEILAENRIAPKEGGLEPELIQGAIEEMFAELGEDMQEMLGKIDFESLFQDLYGHLKNSLNFGQEPSMENEAVLEEVKGNYGAYYQAASLCAGFMGKKLGIWMADTEVCYIAVYLYKNCQEKESKRKNVLIVCATGKGLSHLLAIRIERVFPMLRVVGEVSPYQLSCYEFRAQADFIISTIPLAESRIPVVKISRILSREDIIRIQEFLDYGAMLDEIPMKSKDKASFGAKADPFALAAHIHRLPSRQDMAYTAEIISKLILTLLEYTSKFPQGYQMGQDALLGLVIHISMAVPRWYENRGGEGSEAFLAEYQNIQKEHKEIYGIMEKFFDLVEGALRVKIPLEEKTAFFLYMIKEG